MKEETVKTYQPQLTLSFPYGTYVWVEARTEKKPDGTVRTVAGHWRLVPKKEKP